MTRSTRRFTVSVVRSSTGRARTESPVSASTPAADATSETREQAPEIGGVDGPEPTRYGDWEHQGRCTDF